MIRQSPTRDTGYSTDSQDTKENTQKVKNRLHRKQNFRGSSATSVRRILEIDLGLRSYKKEIIESFITFRWLKDQTETICKLSSNKFPKRKHLKNSVFWRKILWHWWRLEFCKWTCIHNKLCRYRWKRWCYAEINIFREKVMMWLGVLAPPNVWHPRWSWTKELLIIAATSKTYFL